MIDKAHEVGASFRRRFQAVPHLKPDMQALDCDFYSLDIKYVDQPE
jgi:cysteine desulfurase/selenocysteine lyase